MKWIKGKEEGLTLVEVLVALPIAALVAAAATGVIVQVLNAADNSPRMVAMRQVQTAGYWVSQDGIESQFVNISAGNGFPLNLTWISWSGDEVHQIIYSLPDMPGGLKQLQRQEKINGTISATTIVGQYIDASATSCQWTDVTESAFTFTVTAKVEQQTESRIYEIQPRVLAG